MLCPILSLKGIQRALSLASVSCVPGMESAPRSVRGSMCTEKGLEHFHALPEKRIKGSEPLFFFILLFLPYLSSSFKNCYHCCCCYSAQRVPFIHTCSGRVGLTQFQSSPFSHCVKQVPLDTSSYIYENITVPLKDS